jgi:hypothetical protein
MHLVDLPTVTDAAFDGEANNPAHGTPENNLEEAASISVHSPRSSARLRLAVNPAQGSGAAPHRFD